MKKTILLLGCLLSVLLSAADEKPLFSAPPVQASAAGKSRYCSLELKTDLTASSAMKLSFEYRTTGKPAYVALSFEDQGKHTFFFKYPASEEWRQVSLPFAELVNKDGYKLEAGAKVAAFRLYSRYLENAPVGDELQIRNFQITADPRVAPAADVRVSYSAYVLFDWKKLDGATSYRLEYSRNPEFPAAETRFLESRWNFAVPDEALKPGLYSYRVTALPAGKIVGNGKIAIPERHHLYRHPDYDFAAVADAPHPRLLPLARLAAAENPELVAEAKTMLDFTIPPDFKPFKAGEEPGIAARVDWNRKYGKIMREVGSKMTTIGQAALLSGDPALIAKAKSLALGLATGWDPAGGSRARLNDLRIADLTRGFGFCYDAAYQTMTPEERQLVSTAMQARCRQLWDEINPFEGNEAQNHSWSKGCTVAFGALASDFAPERAEWLDFALKLYCYRFLPSLGFDGENNEGLAYWRFGFNLMLGFLDLAKQQLGIDLYRMPYVFKTARFGLYSAPLAGYEISFGDNGTPNHHGAWTHARSFCDKLAREVGDPVTLWYVTLPAEGGLAPQSPLTIPQSIHYPHIGVTFFNTFLADARENVAVGFHSGKFFAGHQHADQNSFTVNAYGDKLIIDGGYYDYYSSPHFKAYSAKTAAHNTILVDGGGQAWKTAGADGVTTGFLDGHSFGYVAGDAANPLIYGGKLQRFDRQLVFVKPDLLITFDRLAADGAPRFSYMLHAQTAAPIAFEQAQQTFSILRQHARLDGQFLTPVALRVEPSYTVKPSDTGGATTDVLDFPEPEWTLFADTGKPEILTAMRIARGIGDVTPAVFKKIENEQAFGVAFGNCLVVFNRGDAPFTIDKITCDGRAAAVKFDAAGQVVDAMMIQGSELICEGNVLKNTPDKTDWCMTPNLPVETTASDVVLLVDGKAVPAQCHVVRQGDGSRLYALDAEVELPEAALTIAGNTPVNYILGQRPIRYMGVAKPDGSEQRHVAAGRYFLTVSAAAPIERLTLTVAPPKVLELAETPADFRLPEPAIVLEAEAPDFSRGAEPVTIARDFVSGGKFIERVQQSDQVLGWNFTTAKAAKYQLVLRAVAQPALFDLVIDGKPATVRFGKDGGDGRRAADWRSWQSADTFELPPGEHTFELKFNDRRAAFDYVALIPVER
jgi:hypothetical protein